MAENAADGSARTSKPGRKLLLTADHLQISLGIVQEMPHTSLEAVARELHRRSGLKVNPATVREALREAGVVRMTPQRRLPAHRAEQGRGAGLRTGCTDMHRRADGASGQNTDLRDAEWALVSDLFEREGQRGTPPRWDRRTVVDAWRPRGAHGLRLALAAQELPAPASGVHVVQALGRSRHLRSHA